MGDIVKSMAAIIRDRKVLVARNRGKTFFIGPGGKLEPGETPEAALIRELGEEVQIDVRKEDLERIGSFSAPAAGQEHRIVTAYVFLVHQWRGEIHPAHEIEEVRWIGSSTADIEIGSIFEHEILPFLKLRRLID